MTGPDVDSGWLWGEGKVGCGGGRDLLFWLWDWLLWLKVLGGLEAAVTDVEWLDVWAMAWKSVEPKLRDDDPSTNRRERGMGGQVSTREELQGENCGNNEKRRCLMCS